MIDSPAKTPFSAPGEISPVSVDKSKGNKTLILFAGEQKRVRPWSPPGTQCTNRGPDQGGPQRTAADGSAQSEKQERPGLPFFPPSFFWTGPQESQKTDNVVKAASAEPVSPTSCPCTQMNVWKFTPFPSPLSDETPPHPFTWGANRFRDDDTECDFWPFQRKWSARATL